MKKWMYSVKAKVVAIIILILLSFFAIISSIGIYYGVNTRIYYGIDSFFDTDIFENMVYNRGDRTITEYIYGDKDYFADKHASDKSNFKFSISNNDTPDIIEYSNYHNDENLEYIDRFSVEDYTITLKIANPITAHDEFYNANQVFNFIYKVRYALLVFLALSIVLIIVDLIFLFRSATHKDDSDEIYLNSFDKIPFDILVLGELLGISIIVDFINFYFSPKIFIEFIIIVGALLLIVTVGFITALSFAVRIKKGIFVQQLFITKTLKFIIKWIKTGTSSVLKFFRMLPYIWQGALITLAILLLNSFLLIGAYEAYYYDSMFLILWFVFNIIVFVGVCFGLNQMSKLKSFGKRIADGDIESRLDTEKMYFHFKEHANNLNEISNGMNIAIEERMKSEHLKTELITNVSHDIKTPLTSIINYVDLMKQEDINNENVEKYLSVVDKQSIRLKKLLEDLVEASKASTGNITIDNTPCELNVLLGQVAGEYEEKLENKGLDLILEAPEESVVILGDGRHLWRIFDNLLNNICKYTQEKTRVYLTLEMQESKGIITFRNISKYRLNITSDELMERFVRGDKSRHTEGSGLGLSIARSLTELQNGTMEIVIDGDLFKVILAFDLYKD